MDFAFQDFKLTIERAKNGGFLDDDVSLILSGKIEYAGERGDITPRQAMELFSLLGDNFNLRYRRALQTATYGEPESLSVGV